MSSILSEAAWNAILARQLKQLAAVDGVTITAQGFVDSKPPHRLYTSHGGGYYTHQNGFQQIEFELKCNAIMECDPRKRGNNDTSPYPISPSDIRVSDRHKLICFFPRSFPADPIGWGLFFPENTPFYPNIMNLQHQDGYAVYRYNGQVVGFDAIDGIICIGAAASTTGTPMHELVLNLKSYLSMDDRKLFTHTSRGCNNDGGFDGLLLEHFSLNYDVLKSAIDNYTGGSTPPRPRTRLGGGGNDKPARRRLGS